MIAGQTTSQRLPATAEGLIVQSGLEFGEGGPKIFGSVVATKCAVSFTRGSQGNLVASAGG